MSLNDPDWNNTCAQAWMEALASSGPAPGWVPHSPPSVPPLFPHAEALELAQSKAALTHTQIFHLAAVSVTDNVPVRVPASGGVSIPTNLNYASIEVMVNLVTADKEAAGKSLALEVHRADNSAFIAGYPLANPWTSYGQQYTVTLPDGTVMVDPDPTIVIPMANLQGQQIYLIYQAVGISSAGVTVNGLKF